MVAGRDNVISIDEARARVHAAAEAAPVSKSESVVAVNDAGCQEQVMGANRRPRRRVESMRRLPRRSLSIGRILYPEGEGLPKRPKTRGECADVPRPCPFVSCRHHLYLDVKPNTGSITFNAPDIEPHEMPAGGSCSLDVAELGGSTLHVVGRLLGVDRERVRQIEELALRKLSAQPRLQSLRPEMLEPQRYHLPIVPSDTEMDEGDAIALRRVLDAKFPETDGGPPFASPKVGRRALLLKQLARGPSSVSVLARAAGYEDNKACGAALGLLRRQGLAVRLGGGDWGVPGLVPPPASSVVPVEERSTARDAVREEAMETGVGDSPRAAKRVSGRRKVATVLGIDETPALDELEALAAAHRDRAAQIDQVAATLRKPTRKGRAA